jgi:hypothetical protein
VDYVEGYCDGLKKRATPTHPSDSHSNSTTSLKTEALSQSTQRTPPNTASAHSTISLTLSGSKQAENVGFNHLASYLPQQGNFNQQSSEGTLDTNNNKISSPGSLSFPPDQNRTFSQIGLQQNNFASLERAISGGPTQNNFSQDNGNSGWSSTPAPVGRPYHTKHTITSGGGPMRRERILSMPQNNHNAALNHYAGNRHELTARVSSVPQHSVFGEDKYGYTSMAKDPYGKIDSKVKSSGHQAHEWSRHSQVDGAMDDLAEMVTPSAAFTEERLEPISSSANPHHQRSGGLHHDSYHTGFQTDPVSPPASPTKSASSPKKFTSPKHRIQQLARGIIGSTGSDRNLERIDRARPESPNGDPKKMGPEEKRRWKEDWRNKFAKLKREESDHIRRYKKENPL